MQLQLYEQDSGCQDESRSKQNIIRILFSNIMSKKYMEIRTVILTSFLILQRLVVCLEESLFIHNIRDMKVLRSYSKSDLHQHDIITNLE